MAVDGSLTTFWQTAKAVGGNRLAEEWITVDLQSEMTIGEIVFEWNRYYAIHYSIMVSYDNVNWITAFSTTSGDGGSDNIFLPPGTAAQYVRLETYSWNNATWRNWLNEFEIYVNATPRLYLHNNRPQTSLMHR